MGAVGDFFAGVGSSVANGLINQGLSSLSSQRQYRYWKQQQEYNSPVNQVARLRAAGLNPYLMGSSITGQAQSQPIGSPDQSSDVAGNVSSLQGAQYSKAQREQVEALTRGVRIDNATKLAQNLADLQERYARIVNLWYNTKNVDLKNSYQQLLNDLQTMINHVKKETQQSEIDEAKYKSQISEQGVEIAKGQATQAKEKGKQEEIVTKYLPKQLETALAEARSRIADNYAGAEQKKANAALFKVQEVLTKIQSDSASIDLNTKQRLSHLTENALRAKTLSELENSINELRREKNRQDLPQKVTEYIGELIDGVIPLRHLFK